MQRLTQYLFLVILSFFSIYSLAHPKEEPNFDVERQELQRIARSLEASLNELRKLEKAKAKHLLHFSSSIPKDGPMSQIVTLNDWDGTLESLLQTIAKQYHYQLTILGKKPALPIVVSIAMQDKPLSAVLQDADLQAGPIANITVNHTEPRTIELRYVQETA